MRLSLRILLSFWGCWCAEGFVVCRKRSNQSPWQSLQRSKTTPHVILYSAPVISKDAIETNQQGGNHNVREIMNILLSRFADSSSRDWIKTRNYVYHANGNLSPSQVKEVLDFLDNLFPTDPDLVRTILQSTPRILRKSVKCLLQPTATFLLELYGPDLFQEALQRNPALLLASGVGYNGENEELESFLLENLELTKSAISKLKKTALFQMPLEKVQTVVHFLESILQKGDFSASESHRIIGKLLSSHAHLINLSVDTNLEPRIHFLAERCNLKERDIAVLVKSSPGILGLSVDHNLRPTIEYLATIIAKDDADEEKALLRKCVLGHPQLLALSLKNLQTKVDYFNAIDGMETSLLRDSRLAARVATRSPAVYSLSLKENIIPTVQFLAKVWGAKAPEDHFRKDGEIEILKAVPEVESSESLAKRLKEYPGVLTLSLEGNIQPTISFYNRTGYISLDDEFRKVDNESRSHVIPGRYIAASLFSRLLPRWHHMVSNEWQASQDATTRLPPLHILVGATDKTFCKQMGFDLNEYLYFKEENSPRLKFSSQFDTWLKTGRPIDVN